ncbi:uncharacterized protein AB675_11702 [Cyphellophora attinorum]|uniref:Magnesium transport protein CorA n=1 Tax=Cyphellophora attinorum TaxID=1664694 RepID=A0A0N0NI37_9EURO|nr:uncharacterized protein AB675_11702 [Phialophora attinorum]KPI35391.1 hypothetical protein AB675_11702 [Phialophora attinorum]
MECASPETVASKTPKSAPASGSEPALAPPIESSSRPSTSHDQFRAAAHVSGNSLPGGHDRSEQSPQPRDHNAGKTLQEIWSDLVGFWSESSHNRTFDPEAEDFNYLQDWLKHAMSRYPSLSWKLLLMNLCAIAASHDPWTGELQPEFTIITSAKSARETQITSSDAWRSLASANNGENLHSAGKQPVLITLFPDPGFNFKTYGALWRSMDVTHPKEYGKVYHLISGLLYATISLTIFNTGVSAFAAALRYLDACGVCGYTPPLVPRYSAHAALCLRSARLLLTLSKGWHYDLANGNLNSRPLSQTVVLSIHQHVDDSGGADDSGRVWALLTDLCSSQGDWEGVAKPSEPSVGDSASSAGANVLLVPDSHSDPDDASQGDLHIWDGRALRSITYYVALAWLRLHWSQQARHQASSDTSRAMTDLKIAGTNLQGWLDASESSSQAKPPTCPLEEAFARQYTNALAEAQILAEALTFESTQLNIRETQKGIELSEKSLREAHAVGRLTQLAFIFLPLTFITGIFGMNITAFGGGAPMWKFYVTTFAILIPFWGMGIMTTWEDVERKYSSLHRRPVEGQDDGRQPRKEMRRLIELPVVTLIYACAEQSLRCYSTVYIRKSFGSCWFPTWNSPLSQA